VQRARLLIERLYETYKDKKEDVDDVVCKVICPADYEAALKGIEMDLAEIRDGGAPRISAADAARSAADGAVRAALRWDAAMDDGEAIPSDAWLDQASMGIGGLAHSLEVAETQRRVPLLHGSLVGKHAIDGNGRCMDEMEYRGILDEMARAENRPSIPGSWADLAHEKGDDDESVHSATSRISTLSMASNISSSGRMTAGQRRRWHRQQQQMCKIKAGGVSAAEGKDKDGTEVVPTGNSATKSSHVNVFSSISGRQQAIKGSHPYLCEVLHDSYGIGNDPPSGLVDCSGFSSRGTREGGTEFYSTPSSVNDMMVFNTSRDSYGLANRRAAAMMGSTVPAGVPAAVAESSEVKETANTESPKSTT
jgi:hypothetical protein